ncbi:MAG TPA: hypothetical protein VMF29_00450 [Candidatus Edwardsbacteria bacterium]|nr:hypothetical protein [Candidatus Edwardsbacteria bacterium]
MITLSPAPPAAMPAAARPAYRLRPAAAAAQPLCFTVQLGPQAYLRQRLPRGLDGREAVAYVRAFARSRQRDCCIEYAGGKTLYLLSDGGQFQAAG